MARVGWRFRTAASVVDPGLSGPVHDPPMTTRQRAGDIGAADARHLVAEAGREIVDARRAGGHSQRFVAARAGISPSQLGRLERSELRRPSLDVVCRAARGVGLAVSFRLFPSGPRVRDAAQLRLLDRFEALLGQPLQVRREVPLPVTGDQRAWDARVTDGMRAASVEAESRLHDIQATERRIALKARDDPGSGVVILLVNRTAHNRRVLAEHRESLRARFPLDGAAIIDALRHGRLPAASGILML
jgi:transcriptional regulator with XRE-family HTH domain